jgi:hypothetical protein
VLPAGGAELALRVRRTKGAWALLARVVFDRAVPGARATEGGWVLETPHVQRRYLLAPGKTMSVRVAPPAVVRIDADAEPGARAQVVAAADGKEVPIALDGEPKIVAVREGVLTITSRGGASTIAIAERVARAEGTSDDEPSEGPEAPPDAPQDSSPSVVDLGTGAGGWRAIEERSAPPLSWMEDALGTFVSTTAGVYSTLREGNGAGSEPDEFIHQGIAYRRRIESINLTTMIGGLARARQAQSTYGANLLLYEDNDATRLRVTGQANVFSQKVDAQQITTLQARGFVEYSWRVTHDFFVLPRLGFDGFYTDTLRAPTTTKGVDDDVFNAFRFTRETLTFAQLLLWWTPRFNDIFYLRGRVVFDPEAKELSHVAVRPGFFFVFGQLEASAFADGAHFQSTPFHGPENELAAGASVAYNVWSVPGSLDVRPEIDGAYRVDLGGYQVTLMLNIFASHRRGLRDFSSLELSFPEQLAGNVPWRGPQAGVSR